MSIKSVLRWISYLLLFLGFFLLGYAVFVMTRATVFQATASRNLEHPAAHPKPGQPVIGRLEVPRLHLAVMILDHDDPASLRLGAGHIPGTAWPGQAGNLAIAGHRDTFFRPLRNIRIGDSIVISTPSRAYRYRVESTEVVAPSDVAVLAATNQTVLTLVTCYPFSYIGAAPERLIVRALLTS
jgi:sortase A